MDPPAIDRKVDLEQRPLPRIDVRIDRVHERPVEVEDRVAMASVVEYGPAIRAARLNVPTPDIEGPTLAGRPSDCLRDPSDG